MIVMLHIVIALASIVCAGYAYIRPTRKTLTSSYALMALTLGSGLYLVVTAPAHMIETCTMGIGYLAVVTTMTVLARAKFAHLGLDKARSK